MQAFHVDFEGGGAKSGLRIDARLLGSFPFVKLFLFFFFFLLKRSLWRSQRVKSSDRFRTFIGIIFFWYRKWLKETRCVIPPQANRTGIRRWCQSIRFLHSWLLPFFRAYSHSAFCSLFYSQMLAICPCLLLWVRKLASHFVYLRPNRSQMERRRVKPREFYRDNERQTVVGCL